MTKVQMNAAAQALLVEHSANKELTAAMTELFEQYMATAKGGTEKREKVIMHEGEEYVWCNRHEVYEPAINFLKESDRKGGQKYRNCCTLGEAYVKYLTTVINDMAGKLTTAIDNEDYAAAKELNTEIKETKERRAGRYNFDDNALQFPDVKNYLYDASLFIKD